MATVVLPSDRVTDFASFHQVCRDLFGFPDFYGANMNAWIDCLTYLRDGDGLSRFHLRPGEWLDIEVLAAKSFRERLPEVFGALVDCTAFVNRRYVEIGDQPALRLILL